jgi:hypothetical protein
MIVTGVTTSPYGEACRSQNFFDAARNAAHPIYMETFGYALPTIDLLLDYVPGLSPAVGARRHPRASGGWKVT